MAGFGGVAEYGITVRWNKNFLKVIRLLLERRARVQHVWRRAVWRHADDRQRVRDGLRSHRAVRGRGAADRDSDEERAGARRAAGVRFPDGAAVDGRGEVRFAGESADPHADCGDWRRVDGDRYGDGIAARITWCRWRSFCSATRRWRRSWASAKCGRSGRRKRRRSRRSFSRMRARFGRSGRGRRAKGGGRSFIDLLNAWGGVTIAYRRRLIDAPSYTLNHEEVAKALEEGVRFAECLAPEEVEVDAAGAAKALRFQKYHWMTRREAGGIGRDGGAAGADDSGGGGDAAEYGAGARRRAQRDRSMGASSRRWTKTGKPVKPERIAKPRDGVRADVAAPGWARDQLFRRSASFVFGQCGEGDGEREAGVSGGFADAGADGSGEPDAGGIGGEAER